MRFVIPGLKPHPAATVRFFARASPSRASSCWCVVASSTRTTQWAPEEIAAMAHGMWASSAQVTTTSNPDRDSPTSSSRASPWRLVTFLRGPPRTDASRSSGSPDRATSSSDVSASVRASSEATRRPCAPVAPITAPRTLAVLQIELAPPAFGRRDLRMSSRAGPPERECSDRSQTNGSQEFRCHRPTLSSVPKEDENHRMARLEIAGSTRGVTDGEPDDLAEGRLQNVRRRRTGGQGTDDGCPRGRDRRSRRPLRLRQDHDDEDDQPSYRA